MYRILSSTVGIIIAVATIGVAAQSPAPVLPTPGVSTRVGLPPGGLAGSAVAPRVLGTARTVSLTTIQGNTLTSTNGVLPNVVVRLRDARAGRIRDTQTTDRAGLFAFHSVEPGTYVVEIVGNDQTILAASQMLNVDAGNSVSAIVKLPFRVPPFGGLLGPRVQVALGGAGGARGMGYSGGKSHDSNHASVGGCPDEVPSGQHVESCDPCRSLSRDRPGGRAARLFLGRQRRP